jgi:hypothetical protein
MKAKYRKAYNVLKVMGVPVFTNEDNYGKGNFSINGEALASSEWADYYSGRPDWVFGVNPAVTEVLDQFGLMAEWVNPAVLGVYES